MADELTNALAGLQYTPLDTGYGIGAQGVAQALPTLVNPYASPLQNLGVTLGGALVASLLGYQAQKESFNMGLQTQQYANQMAALTTPEARTDFLAALPSEAISSGVGSRLSALSRALAASETEQRIARAAKLAELTTAAEFKLGSLGQKLEEQDLRKAALLAGIQAGNIPTGYADLFAAKPSADLSVLDTLNVDPAAKEYIRTLPPAEQKEQISKLVQTKAAQEGSEVAKAQKAAFETVKDLEKTFRDLDVSAVELKARAAIPGDPVELAMSKLKGSLAQLARVSGQTSQLSNVDLEQQLASVIGPQLPMGMGGISGSSSIADRIKAKLEMGKRQLATTTDTTPSDEAAKKTRAAQLRREIDELKALLAQRNQ